QHRPIGSAARADPRRTWRPGRRGRRCPPSAWDERGAVAVAVEFIRESLLSRRANGPRRSVGLGCLGGGRVRRGGRGDRRAAPGGRRGLSERERSAVRVGAGGAPRAGRLSANYDGRGLPSRAVRPNGADPLNPVELITPTRVRIVEAASGLL